MQRQADVAKLIANLVILQSSNHSEAIAILAQAIAEIPRNPQPIQPMPKESPKQQSSTPKPERIRLTRAGGICTCNSCGKSPYKIIADVFDGMKTEEFARCFQSLDGAPAMPEELVLWPVDDAVMMDCPFCKGDKTLALWGNPPKVKEKSIESVGSIDYDSFTNM